MEPKPIEERFVKIIMRELLRGLCYLHADRKLHRDVKASNILVSSEGEIRLSDFGSLASNFCTFSFFFKFDFFFGFVPPEIIDGKAYDEKADIWSLGISAIEMATGFPPHASAHAKRVLYLVSKQPAPSLDGHFVSCCLSKDPTKRSTAAELLTHRFLQSAEPNSVLFHHEF
eukprot:GSMAST32.ASY1.ANO1.1400.1 assembled CDS